MLNRGLRDFCFMEGDSQGGYRTRCFEDDVENQGG